MQARKIVVMGATSGIGYEVAKCFLEAGWRVGVAGRRKELLQAFQNLSPERVCIAEIDICRVDATDKLLKLVDDLGGMDLYFHSSGIGHQNPNLEIETELRTLETNGMGFLRMVHAAFQYFERIGQGHIAVISSIAGTKGLGVAPAYSATKRFQNTYIEALEQLMNMRHLAIHFTDIRPGFVATDLLAGDKKYPLQLSAQTVGKKILRALMKRRRVVVIDWKYRILVAFWRSIPRWLWRRLCIKN
jgi:short-subunit dehydrogenase